MVLVEIFYMYHVDNDSQYRQLKYFLQNLRSTLIVDQGP